MKKIAIVSVHVNTPLLALMHLRMMKQQEIIRPWHYFLVDNNGAPNSNNTYRQLISLASGSSSIFETKDDLKRTMSHGLALDTFFKHFQWENFDQIVIMDSDCFFKSNQSLQILSDEISRMGASGAIYKNTHKNFIHLSLMGVTPEILKRAILTRKSFQPVRGIDIPEDAKYISNVYVDTGRLISMEITPENAKNTECQFFHPWGSTRSIIWIKKDIWRSSHAPSKHRKLKEIYDYFECDEWATSLNLAFPSRLQELRNHQNPWIAYPIFKPLE